LWQIAVFFDEVMSKATEDFFHHFNHYCLPVQILLIEVSSHAHVAHS